MLSSLRDRLEGPTTSAPLASLGPSSCPCCTRARLGARYHNGVLCAATVSGTGHEGFATAAPTPTAKCHARGYLRSGNVESDDAALAADTAARRGRGEGAAEVRGEGEGKGRGGGSEEITRGLPLLKPSLYTTSGQARKERSGGVGERGPVSSRPRRVDGRNQHGNNIDGWCTVAKHTKHPETHDCRPRQVVGARARPHSGVTDHAKGHNTGKSPPPPLPPSRHSLFLAVFDTADARLMVKFSV